MIAESKSKSKAGNKSECCLLWDFLLTAPSNQMWGLQVSIKTPELPYHRMSQNTRRLAGWLPDWKYIFVWSAGFLTFSKSNNRSHDLHKNGINDPTYWLLTSEKCSALLSFAFKQSQSAFQRRKQQKLSEDNKPCCHLICLFYGFSNGYALAKCAHLSLLLEEGCPTA